MIAPAANTRDRPVTRGHAALLVIDVQNGTCGPKEAKSRPEFYKATALRVIPNIISLIEVFRRAKLEVIYTVIENLTADGRDRSLDYKLSNMGFPKGSHEAKVIPELEPGSDEIVLPKTSSSVFNSTNLDYVLRNIGIEDVFVTGYLTDQCIDHAVKDGADRGLLHDLRTRRLCRRDRSTPHRGARVLQGLLPDAQHRGSSQPHPCALTAITSTRPRP